MVFFKGCWILDIVDIDNGIVCCLLYFYVKYFKFFVLLILYKYIDVYLYIGFDILYCIFKRVVIINLYVIKNINEMICLLYRLVYVY